MYPAVCLVQEYQLDGQIAGQVQGAVGCHPAVYQAACLVQEYQLDGQAAGQRISVLFVLNHFKFTIDRICVVYQICQSTAHRFSPLYE